MKKQLLLIFCIALTPLAHAMEQPKSLIQALKDRDFARVQIMIDAGQVNENQKMALLHFASSWGYLPVVQKLLAAGVDVNEETEQGFTPLMSASTGGHLDIVKELINAGARITFVNKFNETVLTMADFFGQKACSEFLVECMMKIPNNMQVQRMYTFLMCMKRCGLTKDLRALFKPHLLRIIYEENRENPQGSIALEEIYKIKDTGFLFTHKSKRDLLNTYNPENGWCSIRGWCSIL